MHRKTAQVLLAAAAIVLFAAGPSLSEPRSASKPRKEGGSRTFRPLPAPRAVPAPPVASAPGGPGAAVGPAGTHAPATPVGNPAPAATPGTPAPATPVATSAPVGFPGATPLAAGGISSPVVVPVAMCGSDEVSYVVPVGLAPVTNRNTCRGQSRTCCDETMGWCLGEGFYWQHCEDCYCGSRCMAPALFFE